MPFYSTVGYRFKLMDGVVPTGSVLLCGALPMHQLERRQPKPVKPGKKRRPPKHAHMARLLFDPQLYLATLDPHQAAKQCAGLATYPWFGVSAALANYDSGEQQQRQWMAGAVARIGSLWPRRAPTDEALVKLGVQECVDLQIRLGCEAIILPSPLTHDPSTTFQEELRWLDEGVEYARSVSELPVYATVALTDICLRYAIPEANTLLELIADAVSARGVQGVYFVVEQGSEAADTRQCGNARVLASALHLTHLFAHDCGMLVAVNFFGVFGLACRAAGATAWASAWYKSLHRLRLADQEGSKGRAYPSYWTVRGAFDVNLDSDFDTLVSAGMLATIEDRTTASANLLDAAARGISSQQVGAWAYSQSNVTTCMSHFLQSAIGVDAALSETPASQQIDVVEQWLASASTVAQQTVVTLGARSKTKTNHVSAWLQAVQDYRRIHAV